MVFLKCFFFFLGGGGWGGWGGWGRGGGGIREGKQQRPWSWSSLNALSLGTSLYDSCAGCNYLDTFCGLQYPKYSGSSLDALSLGYLLWAPAGICPALVENVSKIPFVGPLPKALWLISSS